MFDQLHFFCHTNLARLPRAGQLVLYINSRCACVRACVQSFDHSCVTMGEPERLTSIKFLEFCQNTCFLIRRYHCSVNFSTNFLGPVPQNVKVFLFYFTPNILTNQMIKKYFGHHIKILTFWSFCPTGPVTSHRNL